MSNPKHAEFNRLMNLIDQALEQLEKAPKVYEKHTLRHAIDEMLAKVDPTGLSAKQLQRIEAQRKKLDVALTLHERGN